MCLPQTNTSTSRTVVARSTQSVVDFHRYRKRLDQRTHLHKKLFFFGDYEPRSSRLSMVKRFCRSHSAERTGDFSADSFTIYDPTQPDNPDGTRQAFAGNKITNQSIALKFLSMFPSAITQPRHVRRSHRRSRQPGQSSRSGPGP